MTALLIGLVFMLSLTVDRIRILVTILICTMVLGCVALLIGTVIIEGLKLVGVTL